ncbi:uncharacterized protein [Henckelia pumila]|uniref:uncharacterized protein isoform X5 n=1 Tax=Henckelia pumila TaxID=405737 RepID=UPI003C6DBECB
MLWSSLVPQMLFFGSVLKRCGGYTDTYSRIKQRNQVNVVGTNLALIASNGTSTSILFAVSIDLSRLRLPSPRIQSRRKRMNRKPGEYYFCFHGVFVCLHSIHCSEALRAMLWISMGGKLVHCIGYYLLYSFCLHSFGLVFVFGS